MFGFEKVPYVTQQIEHRSGVLYVAIGVSAGGVNLPAATSLGVPARITTVPYGTQQAAVVTSRSAAEAEQALRAVCGDAVPVRRRDLERIASHYVR